LGVETMARPPGSRICIFDGVISIYLSIKERSVRTIPQEVKKYRGVN
jgi:hypothetical protein